MLHSYLNAAVNSNIKYKPQTTFTTLSYLRVAENHKTLTWSLLEPQKVSSHNKR